MAQFNLDSPDVVHSKDLNFAKVLPIPIPSNSVAGPKLFPSRVLSGFQQDLESEIPFQAFMIDKALSTPAATVVYWCIANNSGSTGGRYWFGYLFGGGRASPSDFVEGPPSADVDAARAMNVNHLAVSSD